ncbi:MAG: ribonuclease III [Thermodesulfobacteriota bacterium]
MIEKKLKYKFKDRKLLKTALTHSSYANECSVESNERLEFLGDAILGCVVAKVLYQMFPENSEGELSKLRSAIVSRSNFCRYAHILKIDKQILLGKGEENTGGRNRESNLSGTFESIIGAIYIDGGYRKTFNIISKLIKECIKDDDIFADYKTKLQEVSQKEFRQIPRYSVTLEEGPPHDKRFHIKVVIASKVKGEGIGKNKKEAEQAAAKEALHKISKLKFSPDRAQLIS